MKICNSYKAKIAIRKLTKQYSESEEQIRTDMQLALDDAWERSREDPAARSFWESLFPEGSKPELDQFIVAVADHVRGMQQRRGSGGE